MKRLAIFGLVLYLLCIMLTCISQRNHTLNYEAVDQSQHERVQKPSPVYREPPGMPDLQAPTGEKVEAAEPGQSAPAEAEEAEEPEQPEPAEDQP